MECFDVVMLTTCIDDRNICGLLKSVSANNLSLRVAIVVLSQNGLYIPVDDYVTSHTWLFLLRYDGILNLSAARNQAARFVFREGLEAEYVMFPDDDSSFNQEFFLSFKDCVLGNTLTDVYCTGTKEYFKRIASKSGMWIGPRGFEAAMSVNMIVDFQTFKKTMGFDEMMGVGAPYGSCEDLDYFIRACRVSGASFRYEKRLWSYHPRGVDKYKQMSYQQLCNRYRTYGEGGAYLCAKHRMYWGAIKLCTAALAGAVVAMGSGDWTLSRVRLYACWVRSSTFISLIAGQKATAIQNRK